MCDQVQMISLSYKQADPSYTVESATRVTFPEKSDPKYITTDRNRVRPRVNDICMESGVLFIHDLLATMVFTV